MEITHDKENHCFYTVIDGIKADVVYEIKSDVLVITHTVVPKPLGGKGLAAQLVATTYEYAKENNYKYGATCSYADVWLKRKKLENFSNENLQCKL